jgi:hypothetical protein
MRDSSVRTGRVRDSTRPSATIRAAETPNTVRQEVCEAMKLATGRATMMPIIRPLITAPTTRPRMASGARCAASGTMICTPTAPSPIAPEQTRKAVEEVVTAAKARAIALNATQAMTSRRFSTRSPSGTTNTSPAP